MKIMLKIIIKIS